MFEWIRRQWIDIKGNLKWDLITWAIASTAGVTIAAGVALWQAIKHAPVDRYLFLALFLASATLFFYLCNRFIPRGGLSNPTESKISSSPLISLQEVPVDPRRPNLKGQVFEILFYVEKQPLLYDIELLVHLQVVNHGEQEVSITEWKLELEVGGKSTECEEAEIPADWRVVRREGWRAEVLEEPKDKLSTPTEPLRKGVPRIGWINFKWEAFGRALAPHNAKFTLKAVDALGGEHVTAVMGLGFFEETGEIRRVESN